MDRNDPSTYPAFCLSRDAPARVVAVCISQGSVPKHSQPDGWVTRQGLRGDYQAHAKHRLPERAISLFDREVLEELVAEGFLLEPGTAGENLTVEGLHVQRLEAGQLLALGDVILRLETPRKPCFVLDVIDPRLKEAMVGRCGYMASVMREGAIRPGMPIFCLEQAVR